MPHRRHHVPNLWDAAVAREFFELLLCSHNIRAAVHANNMTTNKAKKTAVAVPNNCPPFACAFNSHAVADADSHGCSSSKHAAARTSAMVRSSLTKASSTAGFAGLQGFNCRSQPVSVNDAPRA